MEEYLRHNLEAIRQFITDLGIEVKVNIEMPGQKKECPHCHRDL